jgi:methionine salvage enolase-phosphatase E1
LTQVEARSYREIAAALGVDRPSQILFATDVLAEAAAAAEAGWRAVLVTRPGNKPLPEGHAFKIVHTMEDLFSA